MDKTIILAISLLTSLLLSAQNFSSSNFPIVIITTDINPANGSPFVIVDTPRVPATMKIIFRPDGSRNFLTDQNTPEFLNYDGRIDIEIRGSSSQELQKKSYAITTRRADGITNNNVSILGMPRENDWVLNSFAFDPSLMRDYLALVTYGLMGNYSPRGRYCEVIVNGNYRGLYLLLERIKIDDNRINITKLTATDNSGEAVTGGYITKSDKTTGGDPIAWRLGNAEFIHHNPNPTSITPQQNAYIQSQFVALNTAATNRNNSLVNGITSIIDIPTFVDFFIMNELFSNVDGYQLSTFFHKDRNGKLRAGPIWDFNLTLGNDLFHWGFNRSSADILQFEHGNVGAPFWRNLYNNDIFRCYLAKRWNELTAPGQALNLHELVKLIDQTALLISESVTREQSRWGTVSFHTSNISNMKSWLNTRIQWLTNRFGSFSNCSNITVPKLVISKINYNPLRVEVMPGDSLEFIEITNIGNSIANLTGFYFRELGMTYRFPPNSTLNAGQRLFLASNARIFELHYGFKPFGQYSRQLSNQSEKLWLSDAWGNTITMVAYNDNSPWPREADGRGSYLELVNFNGNNNDPANWKASSDMFTGIKTSFADIVSIFPIPARTSITVSAGSAQVQSYSITDLKGIVIHSAQMNYSLNNTINIESLQPHIYLIKLRFDNGEEVVRKLVVR